MKDASAALNAHLQQEVTTLATCWRVTRTDGKSFYFTDHDKDLVVDLADGDGPQTYVASSSYNRSAIKNDDTLAVDNLDLTGVLSSEEIDELELRRGLFDYARIEVFIVNWSDLSQGVLKMRRGWLGEVTITPNGWFQAELRGLTQAYSRRGGELYTTECRADLGDRRCKIPIWPDVVERSTAYAVGDYVRVNVTGAPAPLAPDFGDRVFRCTTAGTTDVSQPIYNTGIGATTNDGTAVFTAEPAWSHAVTVTAVNGTGPRKLFSVSALTPHDVGTIPGRDYFPTGSLNGGVITWETGPNTGRAMEIREFTGGAAEQVIELFLDMPFDIQVGDTGRVYRGCHKRALEDCKAVFNNIVNFRGEPYIPGQDHLFRYPDAKA